MSTAIFVAQEMEKVWEDVQYCSERCRRNKHASNTCSPSMPNK